ncbi:hypothetical protein NAL32_02610 [Chryseobacterium sp. Ch-15]|uniref:Uncharacterized protein n=1 Tax=Chryseobacterium muglaense TaxID=2893752 RepID=A0A9Q3UYX0_9FLAO|nr:hypothetical protein [Chryseobacterium muglaense]MBD3903320.1 hypothetical protein [Chryseobacterium muglaense]MCC9036150.1 hypothetical protein [Chryseobacterium muglaense]MCM2553275.1 hypothetical protein [Chryseobacterium muglaense]
MKKIASITLLSIGLSTQILAQQKDTLSTNKSNGTAPIPLEAFASNKGVLMQMVVTKHLVPQSKFGIFALTEYYGDYKNDQSKNKYLAQTYLTYDILKGMSVVSGVAINQANGFRPTAGLQYVLKKKDFFVLLLPRVDLTETNNMEAFGIFEYQPKFNENWGLYTRFQGLYNHNTSANLHEISYARLRAGLSYKNYQFGLGANFASYGPAKHKENSFGIFVRTQLF